VHQPLRTQHCRLAIAALAFLVANLLHGADHIRQELAGVDIEVFIGGGLLTAAAVAIVIATWRRHPRAPLLATVVGLAAAILVAASHIPPHWSVLSDSYTNDIHPDAASWAVMLLEIAAALLLALVGGYELGLQAKHAHGRAESADGRPAARVGLAEIRE
jgi:ABC-type uncharacterized transport system permease subunit